LKVVLIIEKCTFCEIAAGSMKPAAKIYEDDRIIAFFDKAPTSEFQTLVVPKKHSTNIF
jgi:histidine triad (HIT) family protein